MRGIRVGYSQATLHSQPFVELPEDEDDEGILDEVGGNGGGASAGGGNNDHYRSSGIGIFSQEGMVRGTGMDTDSEDDREPLKSPAKRRSSNFDKEVEGEESDNSYMTVQDTFNNGKATTPSSSGGVADEHVVSMAIAATDRESSETDERTTKRPRV